MNRIARVSVSILLAALAGCSSSEAPKPEATQPEAAKAAPPPPPSKEEVMANWKKFSTPNENHKRLKELAGNFKYDMTWWEQPDSEAQHSKGTTKNKMIFGDRYLVQEVKGKVMGMPFDGTTVTGFDIIRNEYSSVWFDNMGTSLTLSTGSFDTATKSITESGTMACPATGEKEKRFRGVWTLVDKNSYTYAMYSNDLNGKEFKTMEIKYSRVK